MNDTPKARDGKYIALKNREGIWEVVWTKIKYEPVETVATAPNETLAERIADGLNRLRQ